jgi:peptide/nickel transport system substrate-binding protein
MVQRSDFFASIDVGTAALAVPVRTASSTTVLKYVLQADLALLDPGFTPALVTRSHAYLVCDTLYGVHPWSAALHPSSFGPA